MCHIWCGKFYYVYYIKWRDKLIFPKFSIFKNDVFFELGTDILKSHFLCCQIWRSYQNFRECSSISYLSYAENRMKKSLLKQKLQLMNFWAICTTNEIIFWKISSKPDDFWLGRGFLLLFLLFEPCNIAVCTNKI